MAIEWRCGMRFDATVEVVCDECGAAEVWEPQYVYASLAGTGGHYDTSDSAFTKWCASNKWTEDGDKTFCEDCSEEMAEP